MVTSRTRPRLTREAVLVEALRLIDEEGLRALTMRALAQALGVSAPTLYWHFEGRADLLAAIGGRLLAEVPDLEAVSGDWRVAVRRMQLALWAVHERHPAFLEVVGARPLHSEEGTRLLNGLLVVLRRAGHDPATAVSLARSYLWLSFGLIRSSEAVTARQGRSGGETPALVSTDAELLAECGPFVRNLDRSEVYRRTIDLALAGAPDPQSP